MSVSRGDIILVDYPYSDGTGSKVRPALVVQCNLLNSRIDDTILAAISRSNHRASTFHVPIDIGTTEGAKTGLRQTSVIQCENLLTFDQKFIILTLGRLSPSQLRQVDMCLKAALELA